jgi:hypothetical protein
MRFIGNYYSEWAHVRGEKSHHTLLVTFVACAVGATASAAVILSLASSPITQPVPSPSPRAIVRDVGASEAPKTAQDQPMLETASSPRAIVQNAGASEVPKDAQDGPMVEPTPRPAATSRGASSHDELVKQTEAEHQAEVHSQQARKHSRVREPYWRRFAHNFSFSPKPFGTW